MILIVDSTAEQVREFSVSTQLDLVMIHCSAVSTLAPLMGINEEKTQGTVRAGGCLVVTAQGSECW